MAVVSIVPLYMSFYAYGVTKVHMACTRDQLGAFSVLTK